MTMCTRQLKVLLILFFLLSTAACTKPTYLKEKIEQSIIKLCKDEYNLDVGVRIVGSTLGVFIPIEGLVDKDLRLDKEAGEKIEDVALSIHRVTMSTDRPLDIYVLTARDTKTVGAEFILMGAIYDVIRVRLLDISRGEYYKRILRDFRFNPLVLGEDKVRELFNLLYTDPSLYKDIGPIFYPTFAIGEPGSQKIEIVDIFSKEISIKESLFYVKTKEFYEVKPGFDSYKAIFPPGFSNEYLLLLDMSKFPNPIKEIVPKYFYSNFEIRQRNLKETFELYEDMGFIGKDGFPQKELKISWFLSQQIAKRISTMFEEDNTLKGHFKVETLQGSINNKIFRFQFTIASSSDTLSSEDNEIILSRILKLAGQVLHRYAFEDFEGIELIDTKSGQRKIYLSKNDLERFRRNKIKFKDLM